MQLVRYNASSSTCRFKLPRGWGVRKVLRSDGARFDRYYYEPETGKQFRSIKEIQRYLNGEEYSTPYSRRSPRSTRSNHNSGYGTMMLLSGERDYKCRRMIVSDGKLLTLNNDLNPKQLAIVASSKAALMAPNILPDDWVVEEVPRKYKSSWIDRYYYEPGTGLKFRSLLAVERYLAELEEDVPLSKALEDIKENKPLSKVFKLENRFKNSISRKKNASEANAQDSSFIGPPMKVNWVLAGPQGDTWNPFICDTSVPDSVKKQWNDRFMIFMNDGVSNCQNSDP